MKNLLLLVLSLGLLFGGATAASAQETVNFSDLPDISSPSPVPDGYGNLTWTGFFYVDPYEWSGSGQGFKHGPVGQDVGFSPYGCGSIQGSCFASLSASNGFELVSAHGASGYSKNPLVATAYNNGHYVGTQTFMMTTDVQELDFPPSWGIVTQVVFQGSVVLYDVSAYTLGH